MPETQNNNVCYALTIQEIGRSEPDTLFINQDEYISLQEAINNLGLFVINVENEVRYYNIEFLSSIRIKKVEAE